MKKVTEHEIPAALLRNIRKLETITRKGIILDITTSVALNYQGTSVLGYYVSIIQSPLHDIVDSNIETDKELLRADTWSIEYSRFGHKIKYYIIKDKYK